jgi:hypothetical protein
MYIQNNENDTIRTKIEETTTHITPQNAAQIAQNIEKQKLINDLYGGE